MQHNGTERRDLVKMKKLWKKAAALFTAACLTAACCPAFSAAEESSGKASAALASFKADGDVLVNKRSDGEKLHIGGARESRSAVAINGSGFASFDVSTLAADGFTAFVGLDETSPPQRPNSLSRPTENKSPPPPSCQRISLKSLRPYFPREQRRSLLKPRATDLPFSATQRLLSRFPIRAMWT